MLMKSLNPPTPRAIGGNWKPGRKLISISKAVYIPARRLVNSKNLWIIIGDKTNNLRSTSCNILFDLANLVDSRVFLLRFFVSIFQNRG